VEAHGIPAIATTAPEAEIWLVDTWDKFAAAMGALKAGAPVTVDGQNAYQVTEPGGETIAVQTVVIDSLTEVHEMMAEAYDVFCTDGNERAGLKRWGQVGRVLKAMLHDLRSLPVSVIALALEAESDAGKLQPMLFGKAQQWAPRYFSQVARHHRTRQGYAITVEASEGFATTKRPAGSAGVLPSTMLSSLRIPGSSTLGSMLAALYPGVGAAQAEGDAADKIHAPQTENNDQ
jgi:hypothetical protein